jgi:DeoR/GlpR family transcriptional regulator of sugar metabolism
VHYLAQALYVSEPTIRRDLAVLQEQGKIRRTFGGAVLSDLINKEVPLALREQENRRAKDTIARMAAKYIRDGQIIFLDASSTASYLTPYLASFSDLTVITNSPKTSLKLAELKIRSLSTGGLLLGNSIAFVGAHAENFVRNFNADILFFSCRGVTEDGQLTDSSMEESQLRRVMMEHSKKQIYLCTSDKIGTQYMYNLCDVSGIDGILCEKELQQKLRREVRV